MVYSGLKKVLTMSSQLKLESPRVSGPLGRGRKTPAGLARSVQNDYRHGLLASCVLLDDESQEDFQELHRQFRDRFLPVDGVEDGLIEEMVSYFWRMRRACAMATNLMVDNIQEQGVDTDPSMHHCNAFTHLLATPEFDLLHRYEARLQRMFQRAVDTLMRLRDDDRREQAWTEGNAPLQEVRVPPDPIPELPMPPLPDPGEGDKPMPERDLMVGPSLVQPAAPNGPVERDQKVRNKANPISGHPTDEAETKVGPAQTADPVQLPPRKRPNASRNGRF